MATYCMSFALHNFLGKGIPNELVQRNSRIATLRDSVVPDTSSVVSLYEESGGHLTAPTEFGQDPLSQFPDLRQERKLAMDRDLPMPEELFSVTINGFHQHFVDAITYMINITDLLTPSFNGWQLKVEPRELPFTRVRQVSNSKRLIA